MKSLTRLAGLWKWSSRGDKADSRCLQQIGAVTVSCSRLSPSRLLPSEPISPLPSALPPPVPTPRRHRNRQVSVGFVNNSSGSNNNSRSVFPGVSLVVQTDSPRDRYERLYICFCQQFFRSKIFQSFLEFRSSCRQTVDVIVTNVCIFAFVNNSSDQKSFSLPWSFAHGADR